MPLPVSLLVLLSSACAPAVPLSEVPIEGATAEEEAVLREELARFDEWAGPGRVELRRIRIRELEGYRGRYDPQRESIFLIPGADLVWLRRAARHELCHALDFQEELLESPIEPFRQSYPALEDHYEDAGITDRVLRSELLASLCEPGPSFAVLGAAACPDDDPDVQPLAEFLLDHVWLGEPDPAPAEAPADLVSWTNPFAPDTLYAVGDEAGQLVRFATAVPDGESFLFSNPVLDLEEGAPHTWMDFVPVDTALFDSDGVPAPVPPGLSRLERESGMDPALSLAFGDSAVALVLPHDTDFVGSPARRLLALQDGEWRAVEACPTQPFTAFATPFDLWGAWVDGDQLTWTRAAVLP